MGGAHQQEVLCTAGDIGEIVTFRVVISPDGPGEMPAHLRSSACTIVQVVHSTINTRIDG